jgi:hypothetical protein
MTDALHCAVCGKPIGKHRTHVLLLTDPASDASDTPADVSADRLLCITCSEATTLHNRYHPHCPRTWHDLYDHPLYLATNRTTATHALEQAHR